MNNIDIIKHTIESEYKEALLQRGVELTKVNEDLVLLDSGLDSLGFAILVTTLEDSFGYDPFTLMDEPVYPRTYREFVNIYLKFSEKLQKR